MTKEKEIEKTRICCVKYYWNATSNNSNRKYKRGTESRSNRMNSYIFKNLRENNRKTETRPKGKAIDDPTTGTKTATAGCISEIINQRQYDEDDCYTKGKTKQKKKVQLHILINGIRKYKKHSKGMMLP